SAVKEIVVCLGELCDQFAKKRPTHHLLPVQVIHRNESELLIKDRCSQIYLLSTIIHTYGCRRYSFDFDCSDLLFLHILGHLKQKINYLYIGLTLKHQSKR